MSILINGMEMPKAGYIDVRIFQDGIASKAIGEKPYYKEFHVVEVKAPHGRLGDLDALESESADLCCDSGYYGSTEWGFSYDMIDNAPTIIEAEGKDDAL